MTKYAISLSIKQIPTLKTRITKFAKNEIQETMSYFTEI